MVLIKDSLVVDGTGKPGEKLDVLIKDDRIAAIGHFPNQKADLIIDGTGLITTPGFIDVNTDSDHYVSLFTDPAQQDFLLQGVTTIIGGHCGSSLAPLLRGTLESIRKWGDTNQVNVDWNTMAEFLSTLGRLKLGVNFGTLVGHSTIRRALIGEENRDLTFNELDVFKSVIRQALIEGALGVSTGLGYNHSRNTPYLEIKLVAELAAAYNGVYATHLRNEREKIVDSVTETISIAKETGVRTLISHFRAISGLEDGFNQAVETLEGAYKDHGVQFDGYPFDYSMLPIYTLLPEWAQQGSLETMLQTLTEPQSVAEIIKTLPVFHSDDITIARAPGFDYLVSKTLTEFARAQELNQKEALIKLMKVTKLKAVLFKRNINLEVTLNALMSDASLIASNSPSLLESKNVLENERGAKTFSKFLELAQKRPGKTLEWAVEKITRKAAEKFNLKGRGVLAEGAIADVAVLSGSKAVHVFVGGRRVVSDGVFNEVFNGKVLKRV